jgi:hypothetical protein
MSKGRWFRFYDDALDDPKVQLLSPELFKTWINILSIASKNSGKLLSVGDISFRLRISIQDAQARIDDLILAKLIDIAPDGSLTPHNWHVRQYPSDSSTERVKKHRGTQKSAAEKPGNVTETAVKRFSNGTESESDTELDNNSVRNTTAAREKKKGEQKFDLGFLKGKAKATKPKVNDFERLQRRAEGYGLPVEDLMATTTRYAKNSPAGYFRSLCIDRLKAKLPLVDEARLGAALDENPEAHTLITLALMGVTA